MPKLIDYPRTSYTGAWELAEVIDDTGGKCAIETAARKLSRKVSGSFKAIIGSGVKFGLITSKRDLLTTTTLFKRIKHAYDKQEEILFHREAFLSPPLFIQLCRKFRSRELPVQMLDVMLIREFSVEEINAQSVAKAFVDGCRMVGLIDENNIIADIDTLNAQQSPRREMANNRPTINTFRKEPLPLNNEETEVQNKEKTIGSEPKPYQSTSTNTIITEFLPITSHPTASLPINENIDAIANLFGFSENTPSTKIEIAKTQTTQIFEIEEPNTEFNRNTKEFINQDTLKNITSNDKTYQIQINGPGVNTILSVTEEEDITLAIALLEKIRRQLRN